MHIFSLDKSIVGESYVPSILYIHIQSSTYDLLLYYVHIYTYIHVHTKHPFQLRYTIIFLFILKRTTIYNGLLLSHYLLVLFSHIYIIDWS